MGGLTAGTATIVFTDLVGSTELRTRLGDGVADELRRAHDQLLSGAVDEHGGTVVKGLGDGILAAFGAAADAVAASTAIQRAIDRANRRVDDARRLAVRVGVSAGDVSWEDGDCHGTPVVTAARLCDRAVGGQILVDDLVRGLARGRTEHSFRLVGELELKGLAEPVTAYEVPWEPVVGDRAPAARTPAAGGERAAVLRPRPPSATRCASSGSRRRPTVARSRSSAASPASARRDSPSELARAAHEDGAWVLAGRCDENISAPFAPWIEILRHVVAHAPPSSSRPTSSATVVSSRAWCPSSRAVSTTCPTPRIARCRDRAARAVRRRRRPHRHDRGRRAGRSRGRRRALGRRVEPRTAASSRSSASAGAAVLVVVTYRDTDVDRAHPLAAMIGDFRREPRVERYALRGIDEAGIRALLAAAGGGELDELGDRVRRAHSCGRPRATRSSSARSSGI